MLDIQRGARVRLVFSKLRWLMPMKWWFEAIAYVHQFLDSHVKKTYQEIEEREKRVKAGLEVEPERTDLLWNMALNLRDDVVGLRSNIALIFAPNGDPTNSYITNAIWQLARHPAAWEKVREEVLAHGDAPLTFTALRNMKYLMAVLNEAQRLMPGSLIQARTAGVDTTLPTGGGPDGTMPILIRKGDIISLHRNVLHWDQDIWGADAKEFRPERWEHRRSFWTFIPFGGGPRRCPAQMIVSCQASYVIARLAQRYRKIEARDPGPYIPVVRIAPSNKNGVKIALYK
ncbi:Cytochrome p450 protein [Neofusicoccum parvum]|nr:Cytochrome p450 protein [Neofusicoccum parvum]